jgi:hypothetical protein
MLGILKQDVTDKEQSSYGQLFGDLLKSNQLMITGLF